MSLKTEHNRAGIVWRMELYTEIAICSIWLIRSESTKTGRATDAQKHGTSELSFSRPRIKRGEFRSNIQKVERDSVLAAIWLRLHGRTNR